MSYEQFVDALRLAGWRGPDVSSPDTLIEVYNRMQRDLADDVRAACRRQLEVFAAKYVDHHPQCDSVKAQGWAILQAAYHLTETKGDS